MTGVDEIAGRLESCVTGSGGIDLRDPDLLREAAAALRSQAARIAELERANSDLTEADDVTMPAFGKLEEMLKAACAQRDAALSVAEMNATSGAFTARQLANSEAREQKLREALADTLSVCDHVLTKGLIRDTNMAQLAHAHADAARAALQPSEKEAERG